MKIRFIINPVSGTGKQKGIEKLIQNKSFYLHENILKNKHWDLIANESRSSSIIRQDLEANENKTYKQFIREYYSLR